MKKIVLFSVLLLLLTAGGFFVLSNRVETPALIFNGYGRDSSGKQIVQLTLTNTLSRPIHLMCHQSRDPSSIAYLIRKLDPPELVMNTLTGNMASVQLIPNDQVRFAVVLETNLTPGLTVETYYTPEKDSVTKFFEHFARKVGYQPTTIASSIYISLPAMKDVPAGAQH